MLKLQCCDHKSILYSVFKVMESQRKAGLLILDTSKLKFIKADTINSRALDDTLPLKKRAKRKQKKIIQNLNLFLYLFICFLYLYV